MKTILLTAYAVNPYKGSEDGMGWNFITQIARFFKVVAITRENNRPAIEKYLRENPLPQQHNIIFAYYDLPYYLRFWKKGERGAMLYFYLWQTGMPWFIKKHKLQFDIAHNLNFHNDWTPSWLWVFGKPFAWGPVGHHPAIPKEFMERVYGKKAYRRDRLRWALKQLFWHIDPFLKLTAARADHIFCMNSHVVKHLKVDPAKTSILPSVASEAVQATPKSNRPFRIISAGRFVPLKGFDVTIRAFADFYMQFSPQERTQLSLTIVGKGPEKKLLKGIVSAEGLGEAVQFVEWMDREALKNLYNESSAFLFTSHEGAGMVVSEALSFGLPVVCFDNSGPGEFVDETCGIRVPYGPYGATISAFSQALRRLYDDEQLYAQLSQGAITRFSNYFDWNVKALPIKAVYDRL